MAGMKLAIVIVNFRTAAMVVDCLASLEAERGTFGDFGVVVTDNDSSDDSVGVLQAALDQRGWGEWSMVVQLPRNGGFAYGNNRGIEEAQRRWRPELVLLLNPDTIVRPGALGVLVRFLDEHPEAAIAGPRLEHANGEPQHSAFRWPTLLSELDAGLRLGTVSRLLSRWQVALPIGDEAREVDWVSGAALLARGEVFERVGLLDEQYFMYFEELDLCRRAARMGMRAWHVPEARVVHLVGQASGVNNPLMPPRRRPAYWFESRRRYFRKTHGRVYAGAVDAARIAGCAVWRVRRRLQRKPDTDPPAFLQDLIRHSMRGSGA
jgi:N-acetylglucosaminyl-diphospho-decaprenol L-rhamnosyltransferase